MPISLTRDAASWLAGWLTQNNCSPGFPFLVVNWFLQLRGKCNFSTVEPDVYSAGDLPAWISLSSWSPQDSKQRKELAYPNFLSRSEGQWRKRRNAMRKVKLLVGLLAMSLDVYPEEITCA